MGGHSGSTVAPVAPVQDNTAQIMMMEQSMTQQAQFMEMLMQNQEQQEETDYIYDTTENEIDIQKQKAQIEKADRDKRIARQKRQLLFWGETGVEDEEFDDPMLLLGGA